VAERHGDADRNERTGETRERRRACRGEHRGEERPHLCFGGGFGRLKPAALSGFRPRADSTFLMNARPAALFVLAFTTAISYLIGGCAQPGSGTTRTCFATGLESVTYTKPAAASPSATFATIPFTSASWLTLFCITPAGMPSASRICRV